MLQQSPFGGTPYNSPFVSPFAPSPFAQQAPIQSPPPPRTEGENEIRVAQYAADLSGCGFWRMFWPEHFLNAHGKLVSTTSTVINHSPSFYAPMKAVRIQRQATRQQLEFVQYIKQIQSQVGFRLIYEVDDVVFREDIPEYNRFKFAFDTDEVRSTILEIMSLCDEITVTNEYMQDYFRKKTGKNEVTVIPNFPPSWWIGHFFNPNRNATLLSKHRKRPRILYAGSGAHFDVDNKNNQQDDFTHVIKAIIDSRHKYQWVFLAAVPLPLIPYVQNGDIEFHPWQKIYDYPKKIYDLEIQMMVAPLEDNIFNRCKSDIKYLEACCYGLPVACQDMVTYTDAPIKFKTGDEMLQRIEETLRRTGKYNSDCYVYRDIAEKRFLERDENADCYVELFTQPFGSDLRKNLSRFNKG